MTSSFAFETLMVFESRKPSQVTNYVNMEAFPSGIV
jgi:hypothetical protein